MPLLVRYPGHLKPGVSELMIGTLDLMPTLLGLMDLPVPRHATGETWRKPC